MKKFNKLAIFTIGTIYLVMLVGCKSVFAVTPVEVTSKSKFNKLVSDTREKCQKEKKELDNKAGTRYGIDFELAENGRSYNITMNKANFSSTLNPIKDKIKFVVTSMKYEDSVTGNEAGVSVNFNTSNTALTVATPRINVKRPNTSDADVVGFGTTTIVLQSDGFYDPSLKEACLHTYQLIEEVPKKDSNGETVKDSNGNVVTEKKVKEEYVSKPGEVTITLISTDAGSSPKNTREVPKGTDAVTLIEGNLNDKDIDCSTSFTAGSFEAKFCEALNGAEKIDDPKAGQTFQCDATKFATGSNYYVNKNKFYHVKKERRTTQYKYNYNECKEATVNAWCNVTCKEVVTVEYGPPVASKAGLCFEYKVRVTSRVNCFADSNDIESDDSTRQDGKPRPYTGYCTPTPICTRGKFNADTLADYNNQGGPDEDFDICVKNCDHGKYTEKCSLKCYKEVYEGITNKSTGKEISYEDMITDDNNSEKIYTNTTKYGYYCNTAGQLIWLNGKNNDQKDEIDNLKENADKRAHINEEHSREDPRWYWLNRSWGYRSSRCNHKNSNKKYCRDIRYQCYKNTGIPCMCSCGENCKWLGCKGYVYINPSYPQEGTHIFNDERYIEYRAGRGAKDWKDNADAYNTLKRECMAKSICNTKTSEYTIKVGNREKDDKLVGGETNDNAANSEIIQNFAGCYKYNPDSASSSEKKSNLYRAEWALPSSWINIKYGTLTYKNPNSSSYIERKNQHCLPLDAKNVNTLWWNYYYTKIAGDAPAQITGETTEYSVHSKSFKDLCETTTNVTSTTTASCDWRVTDDEIKDFTPEYNINASTDKFGLFEWKFAIQCFYATNNNICDKTEDTNKKITVDERCIQGKKIIRTIDLGQMFPAADGVVQADPSKSGRDPGLNWTKYAINEKKNPKYQSNPPKYMKWIQENGYNVYSEDNLDYEVVLTREKIRDIKAATAAKDFKYNGFDGSYELHNTVNYKSSLLRTDLSGYTKYPNDTSLKCNNMKNYKGNECQTFK